MKTQKICDWCWGDRFPMMHNKKLVYLCPECDKELFVKLSAEALRRNALRIEKGLIKSGKSGR